MITGRQIRAARALLEWTAEDVARETGLTRVTVSKIESESVQAHEGSMVAIMQIFDRNGIEFLPDEGVCVRRNNQRVFSGKAGYRQLLDHIYETMRKGGRVRQFNFGDAKYLSYADNYADDHMKRMGAIPHLDAKVLAQPGDINFDARYCAYRILDKAYQAVAPYYIYGEYVVVALHEAAYKKEMLSIHSKLMAERYSEQFDLFWDKSLPAKKKR